jgi:hypothetical protein
MRSRLNHVSIHELHRELDGIQDTVEHVLTTFVTNTEAMSIIQSIEPDYIQSTVDGLIANIGQLASGFNQLLSDYAPLSSLGNYATASDVVGRHVPVSLLSEYVSLSSLGMYATTSTLADYAHSTVATGWLTNTSALDTFATTSQCQHLATVSQLPTMVPESTLSAQYAHTSRITSLLAPLLDFLPMAAMSTLESYYAPLTGNVASIALLDGLVHRSSIVAATDLDAYATTSQLATSYIPQGTVAQYASTVDLPTSYAATSDLWALGSTTALVELASLSAYATPSMLSDLMPTSSLPTHRSDLSGAAWASTLTAAYTPNSTMSRYASLSDLGHHVATSTLAVYASWTGAEGLVTTSILTAYAPSTALSLYQPTSSLSATYATSTTLDLYTTTSLMTGKLDTSLLQDRLPVSSLSTNYAPLNRMGDYVPASTLQNILTTSSLVGYAPSTALTANQIPLSAMTAYTASSVLTATYAPVATLEGVAPVNLMNDYASSTSLAQYATLSSLNQYTATSTIDRNIATTSTMTANYAAKSMLQAHVYSSTLLAYQASSVLSAFTPQSLLANYQLSSGMANLATTSSMGTYIATSVLGGYSATSVLDRYVAQTTLSTAHVASSDMAATTAFVNNVNNDAIRLNNIKSATASLSPFTTSVLLTYDDSTNGTMVNGVGAGTYSMNSSMGLTRTASALTWPGWDSPVWSCILNTSNAFSGVNTQMMYLSTQTFIDPVLGKFARINIDMLTPYCITKIKWLSEYYLSSYKKFRVYGSNSVVEYNQLGLASHSGQLLYSTDSFPASVYGPANLLATEITLPYTSAPYRYVSYIWYNWTGTLLPVTQPWHCIRGPQLQIYPVDSAIPKYEPANFGISTHAATGFPQLVNIDAGDYGGAIVNNVCVHELFRRIFPCVRSTNLVRCGNLSVTDDDVSHSGKVVMSSTFLSTGHFTPRVATQLNTTGYIKLAASPATDNAIFTAIMLPWTYKAHGAFHLDILLEKPDADAGSSGTVGLSIQLVTKTFPNGSDVVTYTDTQSVTIPTGAYAQVSTRVSPPTSTFTNKTIAYLEIQRTSVEGEFPTPVNFVGCSLLYVQTVVCVDDPLST